MRAPFQILGIPYRIIDSVPQYCILKCKDAEYWQFVAGGGEDNETPIMAAEREIFEETGIEASNIIKLTSMCYVPANCIAEIRRERWTDYTYVLPEYAFVFKCNQEIILSKEHLDFLWVGYEEAVKLLKFDSNKTALYELNCRLKVK